MSRESRQFVNFSRKKFFFTHKHLSLFVALSIMFIGIGGTGYGADRLRPTEAEMIAVMEGHYEAAILSHDALIQGDLAKVRSRLGRIVKQQLPAGAPESWAPLNRRLHKAAGAASGISDIKGAGAVMSDVAEACGSCHAELEIGNIYYWPAAPEGEDELETAMRTHQWATERLWEGVTGPLAQAWPRGAEALANIRLFEDEGKPVKGSLRALEDELREMGRKAMAADTLHDRAQVYGRLLTTCAACHKEADVSIPPAKSLPPWQE